MGDPCADLLCSFRTMVERQTAPMGVIGGEVLAAGKGVLSIRCESGLLLEAEDLLIPEAYVSNLDTTVELQPNPDRSAVTLRLSGKAACRIEVPTPMGTVTVEEMELGPLSATLSGKLTTRSSVLQAGDRVLLQPSADGQTYYLLTKVVKP